MSSHSKSAAVIGIDSTMAFNHAALIFGGRHRAKQPHRFNARKTAGDVQEPLIDMTPPEERLASFAVRVVELEKGHDLEALVTARIHCMALTQLCFGKAHREVTLALARLAKAYLRRGLHAQAEMHAQTVLERLKTNGDDGAIRFLALTTLIHALIGLKAFAKTDPYMQEADQVMESSDDMAERVDLLVAIAAVQSHKRLYGEAAETLQKAMSEKLAAVSNTHPDMLVIFLQLGRAYLKMATTDAEIDGDMAQRSIEALTSAVNVGIANNFAYKHEMGDALFYLGMGQAQTGNTASSLDNFDRSLKIYRQLHGKWSPIVARSLRQIALMFVRMQNVGGAVQYLGLVIRAESHLHGPNSIQVADLLKTRGDILLVAQRRADAVKAFDDAVFIYETLFGSGSAQAIECRQRITRANDMKDV